MGIYLYTIKKSGAITTRYGLTVNKCKWHRRSLIHDSYNSQCKKNQFLAIDAIERAWDNAGSRPTLHAHIDDNGKFEPSNELGGGVAVYCSTKIAYEDSGRRDPIFIGVMFRVGRKWELFFADYNEARNKFGTPQDKAAFI